jgi:hypothetical protein
MFASKKKSILALYRHGKGCYRRPEVPRGLGKLPWKNRLRAGITETGNKLSRWGKRQLLTAVVSYTWMHASFPAHKPTYRDNLIERETFPHIEFVDNPNVQKAFFAEQGRRKRHIEKKS